MKTAFKCNRKNPTNTNALKLKKAQKEQTKYIQNQINRIKDSVEDRLWQTVNKVNRRKSTVKAKLKATSQEEELRKQHFENLLGNPPKVTHEPITRIISKHLDIKLGQFMLELNSVLRKIKNRKATGIDEIPSEVWKTREFDILTLPTL